MSDINKPKIHFHSNDWMNDPIMFFYNGEYHIFYQYRSPRKHWGHIKSTDLLHWEQLPVALTPGKEGPDRDGCWTGCCIRAYDKFHIFYTGVNRDTGYNTVCHAVSDDLITWKKNPKNPIARPGYPYKEHSCKENK
jgi:beta-fructofuranosidase